MKQFFVVLLFVSLAKAAYDCSKNDEWVELPKIPGSTAESVSIIYNNALYVAGEGDTSTFKYDLLKNEWSTVANRLHTGNHENGILFQDNSGKYKWWLVGGIDSNNYGRVQVYTFDDDKWDEYDSLPWDGGSVCVSHINSDIIHACGGIIGFNNGANGGGTNTTNLCAYYHMNDPNGGWHGLHVMPYARNHAATGTDGNAMYIFGGRKGKNVPSDGYNTIQVYFPENNTWIDSEHNSNLLPNPLPVARGGTGASAYDPINKEFYVIGGETSDDTTYATSNLVYNRVDIYNVNSKQWRKGMNMTYPRHGIFPVYWDGNPNGETAIYVASGGVHNGYSTSNYFDKYCVSVK